MLTPEFFQRVPKVELHVHLEGSVRPETLLKLAKRHAIELPADTVPGLRDWYRFRDFRHFVEIYVAVSKCLKTPEDLELVMREFLEGQAAQNILHSEVTFTASTILRFVHIPWLEQEAALRAAIEYGQKELGISVGLILDIVRGCPVEWAMEVADWSVQSDLVVALGLAGEEHRGAALYAPAFEIAKRANLPIVPHAGETLGPPSIWEVLEYTQPARIGHGVRCIEDPALVKELASRQIPLEVCPTSNIALGAYPSLEAHPLPELLNDGLFVTINSDDPPMFDTSLSAEFQRCSETFGFDEDVIWTLCLSAARASLLAEDRKRALIDRMRTDFTAAAQLQPS